MKKFINKPDDFLNESLSGFGKAHSDIIKVSLDPSFVSRKNKTKEGKVSLISGGGSGHAVDDVVTIANSFGTGTNATYKVTAVNSGAVTALEIVNAGAYTAIASGVTGIAQQSTTGSGSSLTVNVTLGVKSFVVGTAGTNYSGAPQVTFAGTGLTQDRHVCTMAGRAATITSSAAIGAAAGTITVSA